jgi:hypothetical protein
MPTHIRGVYNPPHQVIVQGWLRETTPVNNSPVGFNVETE